MRRSAKCECNANKESKFTSYRIALLWQHFVHFCTFLHRICIALPSLTHVIYEESEGFADEVRLLVAVVCANVLGSRGDRFGHHQEGGVRFRSLVALPQESCK